jgi:hypothetical protein
MESDGVPMESSSTPLMATTGTTLGGATRILQGQPVSHVFREANMVGETVEMKPLQNAPDSSPDSEPSFRIPFENDKYFAPVPHHRKPSQPSYVLAGGNLPIHKRQKVNAPFGQQTCRFERGHLGNCDELRREGNEQTASIGGEKSRLSLKTKSLTTMAYKASGTSRTSWKLKDRISYMFGHSRD